MPVRTTRTRRKRGSDLSRARTMNFGGLTRRFAAVGLVLSLAACGAPDDVYNPQPHPDPLPVGVEWPLDHEKVPVPEWAELIDAAQEECVGIDGPVLAAQLDAESGWDPNAESNRGAQGLAQFMPDTWAQYGRDGDGDGTADPFTPADAISSQAGFMCALQDLILSWEDEGVVPTGQTMSLTLASYNAGPGAVFQHGGVPPYRETQQYIPKILDLRVFYAASTGGGGGQPPLDGYTPAPTACPSHGNPYESGLQDSALRGLRCTQTVFPNIDITSGWRPQGSTPQSDHPLGLAVDSASFTAWDTPEGVKQNWQHAHWTQVNADRLGIRYIIFHNYIWFPAGVDAWVPYDHDSGVVNPSLDHHNHVHTSYLPGGGDPNAPLIPHKPRQGTHPRGIWLDPEEALP